MPWPRWLLSRVCRPRVLVPMLILAAALVLARPYLLAVYSWHAAERALARHRPRDAAAHLERCLRAWPRSSEVHLRAARAARLLDDYDSAETYLLACQQLETRPSEASLLEWALLKAENGDLDSVEDFLRPQLQGDSARADAVLEALAAGFLRLYRFHEAMNCLEQCLRHDRGNPRALYLRGRAWERVHAYPKAAADYQEVVAGDPEHDDARLRLANCRLENGEPAEAVAHLEHLRRRRPDDPEVLVRLAFAWNALGRLGDSLELIDQVLAQHPRLPSVLSARGQLAFQAEKPAEAEFWLRQAIAANPYDRAAHYALQQCLEQQGKQAEAEAEKKTLKEVEETLLRLITIANRLMPKTPRDPALHHELGLILMRMGHEELGRSWFQSALRMDAGYRPAHQSLAEYYERVGDPERAAQHRKLASGQGPEVRSQKSERSSGDGR